MCTMDRFSVHRGAVWYGVAEGVGGGWMWGVWVGDCFNDDCTYETLHTAESKRRLFSETV